MEQITFISGWAIIVASLVYFFLGAIWYSFLFTKQWMALREITEEEIGQPNPMLFVASFLLQLIAVSILALFMNAIGVDTVGWGISIGFGMGVMVFALTTNTLLFSGTKPGLHLIDNGYHLLGLTLAGLILGIW